MCTKDKITRDIHHIAYILFPTTCPWQEPDALSRAPSSKTTLDDANFSTEVDTYVNAVMNTLPETDKMLDRTRDKQNHDHNCVRKYCQDCWPNRNQLDNDLKPFHSVSTELPYKMDY